MKKPSKHRAAIAAEEYKQYRKDHRYMPMIGHVGSLTQPLPGFCEDVLVRKDHIIEAAIRLIREQFFLAPEDQST